MGFFSNLFAKKEPNEIEKAISANQDYATRQGWNQTWFGARAFNEEMICNIKSFQKQCGLPETGIVDDSTFRRKLTDREAKDINFSASNPAVIYCNDKPIPIRWNKVKTFKDKDGFVAREGSYKKAILRRNPTMFVTHFDVCLSSKSCFDVLKQRNLSVHFMIDNDGTIYQTLDTKHIAWHAAGVNNASVGVEISNAYYQKYNKTYEQMGLEARPVITDSRIHGQKLEPHLGFYPVQIEAYKALVKALSVAHGIKLQTPIDVEGNQINTVVDDVANSKYNGIVHHFQITTNKIDSAGLDISKVIKEIK